MADATNMSDMSIEELDELITEATRLRDEKVEEHRAHLSAQLEEFNSKYGASPVRKAAKASKEAAVTPSGQARAKPPITHRDDKGNTWTSRGATPRWLKAYEAEGRNREEFRVKPN